MTKLWPLVCILKVCNYHIILKKSFFFFLFSFCFFPLGRCGNDGQWFRQETSVSSVQSLSCVQLFATPWNEAWQASLFIMNFRSLLKLISIKLVTPTISSVILFSSCLQSFPASVSSPMSQFFTSGGKIIGASASASVLPINIQGWFHLWLTGSISLQSKGLSRHSSKTMVRRH